MGANTISTTVQDEAARQSCEGTSGGEELLSRTRAFWNRETFIGSAIFNLLAFAPPAVYSTLSKLWVAKLSSSEVVTTDVYTYIGIIVEVLNDGIPRSAWLIIGDKSSRNLHSRLNLAWTMIIVGAAQGLLMTVIFLATSTKLAAAFVPAEVRHASLAYVRWSSIQGLTSATEAAISSSTRALDQPDVPLMISTSKFLINIVLDFLLISTFRVGKFTPTIVTQAIIRLICDTLSVIVGLLYFVCVVARHKKREADGHEQIQNKPLCTDNVSSAKFIHIYRVGDQEFHLSMACQQNSSAWRSLCYGLGNFHHNPLGARYDPCSGS
ncbi:uncharacterized protein N7484_008211 [Penicillium longicatenatum]|uniref:uncharacterized protein n=1 Tax=Penicillium longicatenatum TaxID=1561947 RepID=UPI002546C91F|nr:uncharacterized protein N7484_008211 [Penicillium longicatenatum]KAJ5640349.1 hypothetical protein N7484_008211 [Penicillium longicatenatum]